MGELFETLAIIVLYNPSQKVYRQWQIAVQDNPTTFFCFIDNSTDASSTPDYDNCFYIPLHENMGIAYAQNAGIREAASRGARYVVFFDQDSEVPEGYFKAIAEEYERIKERHPNLALLGPTIINKTRGKTYKSEKGHPHDGYTITSALISSGTIAETRTFQEVGMMDESLFIDDVDFEWCWRAESKGYVCARTFKVRLRHKVGQADKRFLGFPIIVSSPTRYYYQCRNHIILLRRRYVPLSWKLKSSVRKLAELIVVPIYSKDGLKTLKEMLRGVYAGLASHKG